MGPAAGQPRDPDGAARVSTDTLPAALEVRMWMGPCSVSLSTDSGNSRARDSEILSRDLESLLGPWASMRARLWEDPQGALHLLGDRSRLKGQAQSVRLYSYPSPPCVWGGAGASRL